MRPLRCRSVEFGDRVEKLGLNRFNRRRGFRCARGDPQPIIGARAQLDDGRKRFRMVRFKSEQRLPPENAWAEINSLGRGESFTARKPNSSLVSLKMSTDIRDMPRDIATRNSVLKFDVTQNEERRLPRPWKSPHARDMQRCCSESLVTGFHNNDRFAALYSRY